VPGGKAGFRYHIYRREKERERKKKVQVYSLRKTIVRFFLLEREILTVEKLQSNNWYISFQFGLALIT